MSLGVESEPLGSPGRTAYSGPAPPGAVRAVALDRAGAELDVPVEAGRWRIALDQPMNAELPAVRFLDAGGAVVRAAVPRGEPVPDAVTRCPACGAARWSATRAIVACDRCGHGEELPAVADVALERVAPVIELDPDPLPELDPPAAVDARPAVPPEELATARIAFYGPEAGDLRVSGTGWSRGRLTSLTVCSDGVCVATDESGFPWSGDEAARQVLLFELPQRGDPPPGGSIAAVHVWIAALRRAHEATAAHAAIGRRVVRVDGTPVSFTTASADGAIGALGRVGDAAVTIAGPAAAFPSALRRLAAVDFA